MKAERHLNLLPKIIVVVGPTASGKTALALKLAKEFNGEIVSADSRQIYRGLDIGTAKPTLEEQKLIPHHLIDIKNPNQDYTAAEYKQDTMKTIKKILKKRKLPILVGGTGLYIKTIIDNLKIPRVKPDFKLRQKLEKEIRQKGLIFIFQKLIKLDPEAAYIADPQNPRRITRALEIALKTKKPFSQQRQTNPPLFNFLEIGIQLPKEKLKTRIEKRVNQMLNQGLIEETKMLVRKYGPKQKSLEAIGYREIIDYLDRKISLNEAADLIKKNTWHYARRQLTWFKKDKRIQWTQNQKKAGDLVQKFLND